MIHGGAIMGKISFQSVDGLETMLMRVAKESPTYQKIALYIEKNYLQIIFMTANELAEAMGVSQGSVSRFFMALGYHGYNDFLRNLQRLVSKQLTAPQRLQYSNAPRRRDDPLRTILEVEISNLAELEKAMQGKAYGMMLQQILSPRRLVLVSARMSATLLPYVAYILHKMRDGVSTAVPGSTAWELLELMPPQDVNVIAVAFPRYPNVLIQKCHKLRERGIMVTALTDSRLSPLVEAADEAVFVPVTTASLFDIYSTPMAFFNLLLRDAAKHMPHLQERMEKVEAVERRDNVYFTN
jgi:DNA-binding MurR/RpiR family transcriptional regulator